MKTFKYISMAVLATLAFSACVEETVDWPAGKDLEGAQVYIENSKSVFYVKTAEEKATKAAEFKADVTPTDDDHISLSIARKQAAAEYEAEVIFALDEDAAGNFDVATFSYIENEAEKTADATVTVNDAQDTIVVKVKFPAGIDKVGINVDFDIAALETNVEYGFTVALGEDVQKSNYGASSWDFVIVHQVVIHLPFVTIGSVTFDETEGWYGLGPQSGIVIQVHEDDLDPDCLTTDASGNKVLDPSKTPALKAGLEYARFFIPSVMYQACLASLEAGEDFFEEGDEDYFADGDGLLLLMTPTYEPYNTDWSVTTDVDPVWGKTWTSKRPIGPIMGIDPNGEQRFVGLSGIPTSFINWPAFSSNYGATVYGFWHAVNSAPIEQAANVYTYPIYLYMLNIGGWNDCPYIITWDENKLEPDWANYFKVDYRDVDDGGDIDYVVVDYGQMVVNGDTTVAILGEGYDALYKNEVLLLADPASGLQIPVLVNEAGKASVAADQPLGTQALGKDVFFSQSEEIATKVEKSSTGRVEKITAGLGLHFEGSDNIFDNLKVEFVLNPGVNTVETFLGTFTQVASELCGEFTISGGQPSAWPQSSAITSTVTISQVEGNKVAIAGLVDEGYAEYFEIGDAVIFGEFDPTFDAIVIPAQYFMDGKDATPFVDGEDTYFLYFQPGVGDYDYYQSSATGYSWYSCLSENADAILLKYDSEDGVLYFDGAPNCAAYATAWEISLYSFADGEAAYDGSLYAVDGYSASPYLEPESGSFPYAVKAPAKAKAAKSEFKLAGQPSEGPRFKVKK